MLEIRGSSKVLVNIYQITQHYIQAVSYLHNHNHRHGSLCAYCRVYGMARPQVAD
jgi:hypothetical protein